MRAIRRWERDGASTIVTFDLNIYGPRRSAADVGRALSRAKLFLQRPIVDVKGVVYYNPHYLHAAELLGEEVSETPVNLVTHRPHQNHPNTTEQAKETAQSDVHQDTNTAELDIILNSLSHHHVLEKSLADQRVIKTNLLKYVRPSGGIAGLWLTTRLSHQAKALNFIFRRETEDLPAEMKLWKNVEDVDSNPDQALYEGIVLSVLPQNAKVLTDINISLPVRHLSNKKMHEVASLQTT